MPPEKSKRELRRADLPVEVWARVAARMSLKGWAKASGTCRSTRAVRLKKLNIENTPAAGVQWASRMLDRAQALSLSVESLQEVAQGVACGLYSIKQLQQLIVVAQMFSDPVLSCLPWLLAQASKLELLVTPAGIKPWFPPLATLKHLDLTFHRDAGNFCRAVPSFTGLETLSLRSLGSPGSNELKFGDLEKLGDLPHLRVCVLKAITPGKIMVPKACQLHIGVSASIDIQGSIWRGVLVNIHSISFSLSNTSSLGGFFSRVVNPLPKLRILDIHVHSAHLVFDLKCFAQFKKLRISGMDVAVRVPAGVCWDALVLDATDKLVLELEDLKGFAAAVPRFAASYGNLHGTEALELCTALAVSGIKCAFQKVKEGKFMFWYPAGQRPVGCCCGACSDCLVASEQAVGHVGEVKAPGLQPDPMYMYESVYDDIGLHGRYGAMEGEGMYDEEGMYGEEDEHAAIAAAIEEEEEEERRRWG